MESGRAERDALNERTYAAERERDGRDDDDGERGRYEIEGGRRIE